MAEHPTEARDWADRHQDWSTFVATAARALGDTFRALHDAHYAAPWNTARRDCRDAG